LIGPDDRDARGRACSQGRSSPPTPDDGALPEDGTRANLRDLLAFYLRRQHAVEEEVKLIARLTLLDECLVLLKLAATPGRAAPHEIC
jgi:hypothetical protein